MHGGGDDLTPSQRAAVEHEAGPLLILAGPGSGKTRVVTRRIARLVEKGVSPAEILAITFTNKAAAEMSRRVADLLPGRRVWVSTFHRLCARLLRRYGDSVGLHPNFSIYDTADQTQLVRRLLDDLGIDPVSFPPAKLLHRIGRAKNDGATVEDWLRHEADRIGDHHSAVVARVWPAYQQALLAENAVDFDDLLLHVVVLLREQPELRRELDDRFRFVLVDEYQDTNATQYEIVRALSIDHPNLCATGDPDQSIYGWRGARIRNILQFEKDFPRARLVRLEQNFRSTKSILAAADRLIAHNVQRKAKSLVTDNPQGDPVRLLAFRDNLQEADEIAADIRRLHESGAAGWSDVAVFYRVNALSREIERALVRHRIPFQVAAGTAFYDRTEIKDVLAYLRLMHNPDDRAAFVRIVNVPARGIGATTQKKLAEWADREGLALLEAAAKADRIPDLSRKAVLSLHAFAHLIDELARSAPGTIAALIELLLERTRYAAGWKDSPNETDLQRLANVEELITAARQYDALAAQDDGDGPTLEGFLETTSLASDTDAWDADAGRVTLMTLHAAKGLEFPVVFLVGVEQNLLPHERSLRSGDPHELEEERRLLFVGITRAERQLFLTQTGSREFRGRVLSTIRSQFLEEMPFETDDRTVDPFDTPAQWFVDEDAPTATPGRSPRHPVDEDAHDPSPDDDIRADDVASDEDESHAAFDDDDAGTGSPGPRRRPVRARRSGPASRAAAEARSAPAPRSLDSLRGVPLPSSLAAVVGGRLATGADLEAAFASGPDLRREEGSPAFEVGRQVRHPQYGTGTIVEADGPPKKRRVTVQFDADARRERFVVAFSPLQPIGLG